MLFKFKSKASSDLIMLEADARWLLKIMLDKDPDKGIILQQDLPDAILRLEAAVLQDEAARQQRSEKAQRPVGDRPEHAADDTPAEPLEPVRLAQRASPMIKLLKLCLSESCEVVWGV